MDATMKEFQRLKDRLDRLRRDRDRAQGVLDQLRATLKKEFDVKTLEEAEKLLRKLEREAKEQREEFQRELDKLEKEYPE